MSKIIEKKITSKTRFGRQNVARKTPMSTQRGRNGAPVGVPKGRFFCVFSKPLARGHPWPLPGVSGTPPWEHFCVVLIPKPMPNWCKNYEYPIHKQSTPREHLRICWVAKSTRNQWVNRKIDANIMKVQLKNNSPRWSIDGYFGSENPAPTNIMTT